uniref:Phospholipid/glycerol acyltransferase domain-containing protein n=1 Tax=Timspurckia oligopyrenoides TaxID=708627 RepID=A0A7S1ERT8_9RHOD|mmetsp:Transcript_2776/g.4890  ORF Transcript_2776/g.4890 Transcript_2776/m.4890 type:complete len:579 (+) Transcript_2776:262-1998(+)
MHLLRPLYIWLLERCAAVVYGVPTEDEVENDDLTRVPSLARSSSQRLRRINSELELNISQFTSHLLESPARAPAFNPVHTGGSNAHLLHAWRSESLTERNSNSIGHAHKSKGVTPYVLSDVFKLVSDAMESVSCDSLTRCFSSETPEPWNFLTRHIQGNGIPPILLPLWLHGLWFRYFVLLPLRVLILASGFIVFSILYASVGFLLRWIPAPKIGKRIQQALLCWLASVFVASWGGYIRYHGTHRPQRTLKQIYIANHTSLIDVFILIKDFPFSCIGQRHGGIAGALQDLLLSVQSHVWFDREEGRDRRKVQSLLLNHVNNAVEPMLVFPEGTCVNNEYCIMFKKGSFELGEDIAVHPVAIRYDKRFSDPYWNSSNTTFGRHLFELMTSWAVVCDVYYLPPQYIQPGETSSHFAARVKELVCEKAQLININVDGFAKRHRISPRFLEQRQKAFSEVLRRRVRPHLGRSLSTSNFESNGGLSSRHDGTASTLRGRAGESLLSRQQPVFAKSDETRSMRMLGSEAEPAEATKKVQHRRVLLLTLMASLMVLGVSVLIMLPAARFVGITQSFTHLVSRLRS